MFRTPKYKTIIHEIYNYMYDIPRYDFGIQEISVRFRAVRNIYLNYVMFVNSHFTARRSRIVPL